jgi:hypothetical protein
MSTRPRRELLAVGANCLFCGPNGADDCIESTPTPGGALPRHFISSSVAVWSKSNSSSFECLTALRRFLGKTCRCGLGSAFTSVAEGLGGSAGPPSGALVEKRSGEWSRAIAGLWR